MLTNIEYRPDIDGLRALAVLAVILFHFFPELLPGGFVGVDIFFVISGYLISAIIFSNLKNQNFKFSNFYIRRIKRIFPALLVVLTSVAIFGWFMLYPSEFSDLGKHLHSATTFVANLTLYKDRDFGYFHTSAEFKPLVHIWSLSVEEQFYILYPIGIFILHKIRRFTIYFIILALALSFALNLYYITKNPKASFFFLQTRAWEMLLGSVLAYITFVRPLNHNSLPLKTKNLLSIIGICLILYAALAFDDASSFPGWLGLVPTLGACLVIITSSAWLNQNILSHRILVWVGLISYPLYLWHWPLISFARIINGQEIIAKHRIIILIGSFVLAAITTHLIERPLRARYWKITYPLLLTMTLILAIAIGVNTNFIQSRSYYMDPAINKINFAAEDWAYHKGNFAKFGNGQNVTVFFGDSNIEQYWPRIEKLMENGKRFDTYTVVFATMGSTMPIPNDENKYRDQQQKIFVTQALNYIKGPEVKTVVLGAQWMGYFNNGAEENQNNYNNLEKLISELKDLGKKVYLILNIPIEEQQSSKAMIKRHIFRPWKIATNKSYNSEIWLAKSQHMTNRLKDSARNAGAIIIDPVDHLCKNGQCIILDEDGIPCYKDGGHLRAGYVRDHIHFVDQLLAIKD